MATYDHIGELKRLMESNSAEDIKSLNLLVTKIIENKKLHILKSLCMCGYKIDILNEKGQTALHVSFYKSPHAISKCINNRLIYNSVGDVNYTDDCGLSLLHIACFIGNTDMVIDFLNNNEDKNAALRFHPKYEHYSGYTPLHFAVLNHQLDIVKLLLKHGANVNLSNIYGTSSLHLAASVDYYEDFTCWKKDLEILKVLISHTDNLNAKDKCGNTPLHNVFSKFYYQYELSYLNLQSSDSESENCMALSKPVKLNKIQYQKLEILLKSDVDVNVRNNDGDTILHRVISDLQSLRCAVYAYNNSYDDHEHVQLVEHILSKNHNIDINAKNNQGATPMQLAVSFMSSSMIDILLKYGANLNGVRLDFDVPNCFWHHYIYPEMESIENFISVIDILMSKGFVFTAQDKLFILKFLVHDTDHCKCWDKNCHDKFFRCHILMAYGSSKHITSFYQKWLDAATEDFLRHEMYEVISTLDQYWTYFVSEGFYIEDEVRYMLDNKRELFKFRKLQKVNYNKKKNNHEIMTSTKIKDEINLIDLMKRHPHDIYQFICDIDYSFLKHFPFSEIFIKGHFTKSIVRHNIGKFADEFLKVFFFFLPELCYQKITKYLKNEDILNICSIVITERVNKEI